MAFIDACDERIDIDSISYTVSNSGEESKVQTALYTDVPCRVHRGQIRPRIYGNEGAYEPFTEPWIIVCPPEYNGAKQGDLVKWRGGLYTIVLRQDLIGGSEFNHVVYTVDEKI